MKKLTLDPFSDRVLVQPAAKEKERKSNTGRLIIPEGAKEKPNRGIVRAVGPSVTQCCVDDDILFAKYAGSDVDINGIRHVLLREDDIHGRITGGPAIELEKPDSEKVETLSPSEEATLSESEERMEAEEQARIDADALYDKQREEEERRKFDEAKAAEAAADAPA